MVEYDNIDSNKEGVGIWEIPEGDEILDTLLDMIEECKLEDEEYYSEAVIFGSYGYGGAEVGRSDLDIAVFEKADHKRENSKGQVVNVTLPGMAKCLERKSDRLVEASNGKITKFDFVGRWVGDYESMIREWTIGSEYTVYSVERRERFNLESM